MQKARPGNPDDLMEKRAAALTKAALDAAHKLGLSATETASVIGVQQGALAAMRKGERVLDGMASEAERADGLVRVVRQLQKLLGDAETAWRSWLRRESQGLGDKPLVVLQRKDGPQAVAAFVERQSSLD